MSDNNFIPGFFVKPPVKKDGSPLPSFIKAKGSIKVADLMNYLAAHQGDWLNFDIKESRNGKWYCQVDDWKPTSKQNGGYQQNQPRGGYQQNQGYQPPSTPSYQQPPGNDFPVDDDIPF